MTTLEISGRSDAPARFTTCSTAFIKIIKSVTYYLGTKAAYQKLFCYALMFFRMSFRKDEGRMWIWRGRKRDTWRRAEIRQERWQQEEYWNKRDDPQKQRTKKEMEMEMSWNITFPWQGRVLVDDLTTLGICFPSKHRGCTTTT